nr:reverse transcriptase domain-containing protein [Tanacetum cinerariifolium]
MVEGKPFNMEHKLNEYSHVKPIKQNKRGLGLDRNMAACKEKEELTKAWILQKGSGFLDAYKGYHQIQMAEEDEDKTAFYAREGVFCYKKMPFGLKNAGATYQRLVEKVFSHQIRRNLEAYVDDMVIKRRVAKWAIELKEHDIMFLKRNEKETPADFLVEIPFEDNEKKEKPKEVPNSNSKEYTYALRFEFETMNNEAEYEALLAGLWIAHEMELQNWQFSWTPKLWEVAKAIQDYEKCKEQSAIRKAETIRAITTGSMWPFSHLGIHILGLLPMSPRGLQFLAIAVEHSTKWVEAKPLTTIKGRQVEKFV